MAGAGGGRAVLDGLHLAWTRAPDLPSGEGWLSPGERAVLAGLGFPKRRNDWLLGRWAAKRAVLSLLARAPDPVAASAIEVLPDSDGRPGTGLPGVRLSISHAGGVGFAAASRGPNPIGCDVEVVAPRSEAFVEDYLTPRESAAVRQAAPDDAALVTNLIWSAKESALKALGQGLRLDTRAVEVRNEGWLRARANDPYGLDAAAVIGSGPATTAAARPEDPWRPLRAAGPRGARFEGRWRTREGLIWTVLTMA